MLHFVHQLVANCVFTPFGAEQVVYSEIYRTFSVKSAACCGWKQRRPSGESEQKQEQEL